MEKIGKAQIEEAKNILRKYKSGKQSLDERIVSEEEFWKLRQWRILTNDPDDKTKPTSAWMFNTIVNKHADVMDSYPELKFLAREKSDEESADLLTKIAPVLLAQNDFEGTYADNNWYKLKYGCCAYGVFWDAAAGSMGDVVIKKVDLLNLFWEPGITDIEDSENLFILAYVPTKNLREAFPKKNFSGGGEKLKEYYRDDAADTSDKTVVVDWYYKKQGVGGEKILHYCKFAEDEILFASENEKGYEDGWYTDGKYPIVLDVLFPVEGSPAGFGYIYLTKDSQLYIDMLDNAIMDCAMMATTPRYFSKASAGVNEEEFLDWKKPIIHVEGDIDESRLRQLTVNSIPGYIHNFRQAKIDEMKETSNNRDFSQGSTMGGVTSGAAIATLQEAGNKTSRDMIKQSYRAYRRIAEKMVERLRQFYDEKRTFRIAGERESEYAEFSNEGIRLQSIGNVGGKELFRKPVFDIDIKAQKMSPFSTLSQNETAMNLYQSGFFNPQNADMALAALSVMDFEGKKEIEEYIIKNRQTQDMIMQLSAENERLRQMTEASQSSVGDVPQKAVRADMKNPFAE